MRTMIIILSLWMQASVSEVQAHSRIFDRISGRVGGTPRRGPIVTRVSGAREGARPEGVETPPPVTPPPVTTRPSAKETSEPQPLISDGDGIADTDSVGSNCQSKGMMPMGDRPELRVIERAGYCPSTSRSEDVNFCACVADTAGEGRAGFARMNDQDVFDFTGQLIEFNIAMKIDEMEAEYNHFSDELMFALGEPEFRGRALALGNLDCYPGKLPGFMDRLGDASNPARACTTPDAKSKINQTFFAYGMDQRDYLNSPVATSYRPNPGANFTAHLEDVSMARYTTFPGRIGISSESLLNNSTVISGRDGRLGVASGNLLSYLERFKTDSASIDLRPGSTDMNRILASLLMVPAFNLQASTPEQQSLIIQKLFSDILQRPGVSGTALSQSNLTSALQAMVSENLDTLGQRCEGIKDTLAEICELASIRDINDTQHLFRPSDLPGNPAVARVYARAQMRLRTLGSSTGGAVPASIPEPTDMAADPIMVDDYQNFLFRMDAWTCSNTRDNYTGAYDANGQMIMDQIHQANGKQETIGHMMAGGGGGMMMGTDGGFGGQRRDRNEYYSNIFQNRDELSDIARNSGIEVIDGDELRDRQESAIVGEGSLEPAVVESAPVIAPAVPLAPSIPQPNSSSVDFLPNLGGDSSDGNGAKAAPLVAKPETAPAADSNEALRRQIEEMRATITKRQEQLEKLMQERNRQAQAGANTGEIDSLIDRRRQELLDLDRQLQERRTRLAQAASGNSGGTRAPASFSDASGGASTPGGSALAPTGGRSGRTGGTTSGSSAPSVTGGGGGGSVSFSNGGIGGGGALATTGLASLGVVSDYQGPQLFLNGQKFDSNGKFIIEFNRLVSSSPDALREIFRLSGGNPIFVRFEDNSLKEYVPQSLDNNGVVFIPRESSANREVASRGEEDEAKANVGEEGTEGRVKHSDLVEILDTNVETE